ASSLALLVSTSTRMRVSGGVFLPGRNLRCVVDMHPASTHYRSNSGCSIRIVENNRCVCQGVDSVCSELFLAGEVNFTVVGVEVGGRDGFGRVPFVDVD